MTKSTPSFLKQRHLDDRFEVYLEADRIRVYSKKMNGDVELFIPYEELSTRTRRQSDRDGRLYNIALSFAIFAAVGFIAYLFNYPLLMRWAPLWAIAAIIFFGFYLYRKRSYLVLELNNGKALYFLANNPSKQALEDFFKEMFVARDRYFRKKYFAIIDPSNPEGELARFQWLLDRGIISKPEFEDMKTALLDEQARDS